MLLTDILRAVSKGCTFAYTKMMSSGRKPDIVITDTEKTHLSFEGKYFSLKASQNSTILIYSYVSEVRTFQISDVLKSQLSSWFSAIF